MHEAMILYIDFTRYRASDTTEQCKDAPISLLLIGDGHHGVGGIEYQRFSLAWQAREQANDVHSKPHSQKCVCTGAPPALSGTLYMHDMHTQQAATAILSHPLSQTRTTNTQLIQPLI